MNRIFHLTLAVSTVFLSINIHCFSQTEKENSREKKSKFHAGVYLGSYFANKYTAKFYDGYGYTIEGEKNDFFNSFMRQRIIIDYGGGNGLPDQIAIALGVNPGEWTFDQTDMPLNMKYNPAATAGVQLSYTLAKKDALFLHTNVSRHTAIGNFTIVITSPSIGPQQPNYENIQTFSITGSEQRIVFQAGYRKILGEDDLFNFFVEAGPLLTLTKYLRNQITINNLNIDMSSFYNQPYYPTYRAKYLKGNGVGAFTALGLDLKATPKWNLQLLYTPSYEKINMGKDPKHTLHHSAGIRVFYRL